MARSTWLAKGCMALLGLLCAGSVAHADHDQRPIAVPRTGMDRTASRYPSTLDVVAPGGPSHASWVGVELHAVTHPCPEDLAVLLVHDNTDKYLLMSNAGGCRPLQGTSIRISPSAAAALPDNQAASPPHGSFVSILASNYGAVPEFPAPAPQGPYTLGLPPSNTLVQGRWDLYVIDTTADDTRGIIAAGWSLTYATDITVQGHEENFMIPGVGSGPGAAAFYPLVFNLETVPADVRVSFVDLRLTMNHTNPDDLRILLESPAGTAVILMANAGGPTNLTPGTIVRFTTNGGDGPVPNSGPIQTGLTNAHQPGGAYGDSTLAAPAPQPPYATSFDAFAGQPARGSWRLWIYDDFVTNAGVFEHATLILNAQPPFQFTPVSPAQNPLTWDQPFVRVEATITGQPGQVALIWRSTVDGAFYDAGPFLPQPGTNIVYADVPLKHGSNAITASGRATRGTGFSELPVVVTVNEMRYTLAEGATGAFFDTDVTLANPSDVDTQVLIDFLPEGGSPVHVDSSVPANEPLQMRVEDHVPAAAVSTIVKTRHAPLAIERTMSWDDTGYGGHGGTAAAPATRWLFAEGSQGYFSTYILLANDNDLAAQVHVEFLVEGGGPNVAINPVVPPHSRLTFYAGDNEHLVDRSFGIEVSSDLPIIAERAMYLPGARLFEGGHESAGVNSASRTWFLAEGATGPFFECFVLISNPNAAAANVTLTYLLPDGTSIPQQVVVPARRRMTIDVETVAPELLNAAVSTTLISDVDIVVERAMYWPDLSVGWQEAHNSFGVTLPALRWGLADGRLGGARQYETYVLLANPNPIPAEVHMRLFKPNRVVNFTLTLPPTSRRNVWVNQEFPDIGEGTFGIEAQVLNYQPIVVEKALYWNAEGVVWAAGTNVVATPLPPR